jgi:hypothetical protein
MDQAGRDQHQISCAISGQNATFGTDADTGT